MIGDVLIANLLASAGLVLLIYCFDFNEKEPVWILVKLYVLSILATFCFGKVKGFLFAMFGWNPVFWVNAFVAAGFFEELLKLILALAFVWHLKSFDEEMDGIIYFLFIAAGFSVLENLGYSLRFVMAPYVQGVQTGQYGRYGEALRNIVLLRMFSGHVFFGVVSGFFLGAAKFTRRKRTIAIGFGLSVLLHGIWNLSARQGWLGWYSLGFFILDACLIFLSIRRSFYYKFVNRLTQRIRGLIQEARENRTDENLLTLMEGVLYNVKCLRKLEGRELKNQAKEIILTLPVSLASMPKDGPDGLTERLVKLNGILCRDRYKTNWTFWGGFFLKFFLPGFVVLMVLVWLM